MAHLIIALNKNDCCQFKPKVFVKYTFNIFIIVLSPEEMPNVSPTDLMNQDTLMLSNQTTLTEEYIQKEEGNLKIKQK